MLGVPVAVVLFALLLTLMFPVGGGIAHIMFAYTEGGSLGGGRAVFVGFTIATALVTAFLRRTRYPLPWYGTAILVSGIAIWGWSQPVFSSAAGAAFRRQGMLLMPLLPATAYAVAYWSERRRQRRGDAPAP